MKRLLLFDFDRTLLNTDALKAEQTLRIARITRTTPEEILEGMRGYIATIPSKNDFSPEGYALFLQDNLGVNPSDVLKIYITVPSYVTGFLYPEALPIMTELRARGYRLGIYSEARKEHQRLKLERTGVLELCVQKYVIIAQKKVVDEVVLSLPQGTIIVDDDRGVIEGLQRYSSLIEPIWLNRKSNDSHPEVRTIFSLTQLLDIFPAIES